MGYTRQKSRKFYVYAVLWGAPGLLTLNEAHRLYRLPQLKDMPFAEGPIGYMVAVGLLLMGFCLWEILKGLQHQKQEDQSSAIPGAGIPKKVYISIAYMILFLLLVPILGFILASGCFLVGCLRLLGCNLKAIAITVFVYCGTLYWAVPHLGLSVPRGMFGI